MMQAVASHYSDKKSASADNGKYPPSSDYNFRLSQDLMRQSRDRDVTDRSLSWDYFSTAVKAQGYSSTRVITGSDDEAVGRLLCEPSRSLERDDRGRQSRSSVIAHSSYDAHPLEYINDDIIGWNKSRDAVERMKHTVDEISTLSLSTPSRSRPYHRQKPVDDVTNCRRDDIIDGSHHQLMTLSGKDEDDLRRFDGFEFSRLDACNARRDAESFQYSTHTDLKKTDDVTTSSRQSVNSANNSSSESDNQVTPNKSNMRNYSFQYKNPKPCRYCDFKSDSKLALWSHLSVHVPADKLLRCSQCPFVTELKHHLRTHSMNHRAQKPYKCSLCSYRAVNKAMINSHARIHSDDKPFVCPYPPCSYRCKFINHIKTHCEKKHGHARRSRRSKPPKQNPGVDDNMTSSNQHVHRATSGVDALYKMTSPAMNTENPVIEDTPVNWALTAAAAASVWNPHVAAALPSLFASLLHPVTPSVTSSPLRKPVIPSSFHHQLHSSPVSNDHFSPVNARIGALNFTNSPAAAKSFTLQVSPPYLPADDARTSGTPAVKMVDVVQQPGCSATLFHPTSMTMSASTTTSTLPDEAIDFTRTSSTVASTRTGINAIECAPLDLTKKPSLSNVNALIGSRKSVPNDGEMTTVNRVDMRCHKQSRRKGVAHKLDVTRVNCFVDDNLVELTARNTTTTDADLVNKITGLSDVKTVSKRGEECEYCDCVFYHHDMYVIHMEFHGSTDNPWTCNKCHFQCSNRVEFNHHIATSAHPATL